MIFEIVVLKDFAIFTGKHLGIGVSGQGPWQALRSATLLERDSITRCFPVMKIFKNRFFIEHLWLLLKMSC